MLIHVWLLLVIQNVTWCFSKRRKENGRKNKKNLARFVAHKSLCHGYRESNSLDFTMYGLLVWILARELASCFALSLLKHPKDFGWLKIRAQLQKISHTADYEISQTRHAINVVLLINPPTIIGAKLLDL